MSFIFCSNISCICGSQEDKVSAIPWQQPDAGWKWRAGLTECPRSDPRRTAGCRWHHSPGIGRQWTTAVRRLPVCGSRTSPRDETRHERHAGGWHRSDSHCTETIQGDHMSGKLGNAWEFNSCRGIDQTAEKKSAKNLVRENCPLLTSSLGLY